MFNRDLERLHSGHNKQYVPDYLNCGSCGSTWFETIVVSRFDSGTIGVLGQKPSSLDTLYLLKCIRCHDLQEPPINAHPMSPLRKDYDSLLDTLEEKVEKVSNEEKNSL